jgi:enoyl-CoA hydratase/carnithine racemase
VDACELDETLRRVHEHAGAVVLRGTGHTFCSGVDGRAVCDSIAEGWGPAFDGLVSAAHRALRAILECRVPLLAAVDGGAAFALASTLGHPGRCRRC